VKSVDEHLEQVLGTVRPLQPLPLTLGDAHGCVLAEDIAAGAPMPPFDNSAMDGYAVRAEDVAAAAPEAPVRLSVVGDVRAGSAPTYSVQPGYCLRIMTGAPVPAGAGGIVPVEHTDGAMGQVTIFQPVRPGQHIRRAGEDQPAGAIVLSAGAFLGAAQLGLVAAAGRASVMCRPRPRVVVISTGDELVEVGEPVPPGRVLDSNSHMLTAAAREAGAMPYRVGVIRDDPRLLIETLEDHLIRADVLVTSGGVSAGAYDVVKDVLSKLGTVRFDQVAMQPGMPQGFGVLGPDQTPIFTLPGNPVSALVSFEIFVRPALRKMLGADVLHRPSMSAIVTEPLRSPQGKRSYLRGVVERQPDGRVTARSAGGQGSHHLSPLAVANALLVVPEHVTEVPVGTVLAALLLERRTR
jgi:molybdopterin molybdotransferase